MLIPQGMGYADVAGLPYVVGLYSGFAPLLIYCCTGTSRQMGLGPVAIVSLLVAEGVPACNKLCPLPDGSLPADTWPSCNAECAGAVYNPAYWQYATCIAMMSGIIQVVFGPLLGFVMNFVPHPVISGFTSAGGLIIAMSQLKDIMGYQIRKGTLQLGIYDFFAHIEHTHGTTCVMGVIAIVFLYFMRKLGQGKVLFFPKVKVTRKWRIFGKLPWPFIAVILYTGITYGLRLNERGVKITGKVPGGLPKFSFPSNFFEAVPKLISITIQIVIIGYLESIAVETKFATILKYPVRPTQEAIAQGAANIMGGLTFCYPVVGSFSRSATNASYGSQSPMCNLITGLVIMFTLLFLTNLFQFMPLNILAAIVIVAAVSLVDPSEALFLWKSSKKEFALLLITFVLTAFAALELGIYVSIALCGAEVLFKSTRPKVAVLSDNFILVYLPGAAGIPGIDARGDTMAGEMIPPNLKGRDILVVRVEGDLNFSAASSLKNVLSSQFKAAIGRRVFTALVFDLEQMDIVDTTALDALIVLVEEIESHNVTVFIAGVPPGLHRFLKIDSVKDKLSNVSMNPTMEDFAVHELERLTQDVIDGEHVAAGHKKRYQKDLAHAVEAAIVEDEVYRRRSKDYAHSDCDHVDIEGRESLRELTEHGRSHSDVFPS